MVAAYQFILRLLVMIPPVSFDVMRALQECARMSVNRVYETSDVRLFTLDKLHMLLFSKPYVQ